MTRKPAWKGSVHSLQNVALLVALLATAACAVGWYMWPKEFFPAYLVGFVFWLGISLGCLAIAMIHHMTGGGWGLAIRRVLEAGYSPIPLMALLFVPLALDLPSLYVWARPDVVAVDELLLKKVRYLNVESFQVRAVAYFAIWWFLAATLNQLSAGSDAAGEPARRRKLALIGAPGLILWCLTVTFASVDWVMSLEPHWFSSMYGVLYMAGFAVSGLSLCLIVVTLLNRHWPWSEVATPPRVHDLGNLLLAFVAFWSYVSFMQYLIIWSGNLPEESPWYINRSAGGWQILVGGLIGLHFIVPFLLLLSRQTKQDPQRLLAVALLLLFMRLVDLIWLVMPAVSPGRLQLHWLNLAAPVAIGGWWLAAFAWRLSARASLPVYDSTELQEADDDVAQHAIH